MDFQTKVSRFLIRNNPKLTLLMLFIFSTFTGIEAMSVLQWPTAENYAGLGLAFVISIFYAVLAYYSIRNELMDELMARLSSEGKENDSKHIDA